MKLLLTLKKTTVSLCAIMMLTSVFSENTVYADEANSFEFTEQSVSETENSPDILDRNDLLTDEYITALDELKLNPKNPHKMSAYLRVRKKLENENMLMSAKDLQSLSKEMGLSTLGGFKPCKGIEKKYDVIRKQSSYTYKKKKYQYYCLTVTDKYDAPYYKFVKNYSPNYILFNKAKNVKETKDILSKKFMTVFGSGMGKIIELSGHPVAGKTIKTVFKGISAYGRLSDKEIYIAGNNFWRLRDVSVSSTMKYYWVKYKGRWEFAYSCDRTRWVYTLDFGKYIKSERKYDYDEKRFQFDNNGTFFKPYKAIEAIVTYKKLHGDKATMGTPDPYGYHKTDSYEIRNRKKKLMRTFKPGFVKRTIDLM